MRILLIGPFDTLALSRFINGDVLLPSGYPGAPFLNKIVFEYLRRGNHVTIITTSTTIEDDYLRHCYKDFNLSVIIVKARKSLWLSKNLEKGKSLDFFEEEVRRMKNVLDCSAYDIVHCHWTYEFARVGLEMCPEKCVITSHDDPVQVLKYTRNIYRLFRLIMANQIMSLPVAGVTFVSPYLRDRLDFKPSLKGMSSVIPNPVEFKYSRNIIKAK